MERITKQTEKLNQEVLTDIRMDTNRITGNISLSEPKGLLISVPYSKGFRAYVDGKETELKKANTMYMALELPKGEHELRLEYRTPFLMPGICLTLVGGLCYICLVFVRMKLNKKKVPKV